MTRRALPLVAVGAVTGLTWAAALRGWMVELAGASSSFSWSTVVLVLGPSALLGALLGWFASLHRAHRELPRWAVWTPALLASALLDPSVLEALVTSGQGSGALMVVATAMGGGVLWSRRGWSARRLVGGLVWGAGVLTLLAMGSIAGSFATPRVALVGAVGAGLVGLLGVAAAVTHAEGLVLSPRGWRVLTAATAATWAGSAGLLLLQDWPWREVLTSAQPRTVWALTLAGGLATTAVAAAAAAVTLWRQPQTSARLGSDRSAATSAR